MVRSLSDAELVALLIEPGRRGKSSLDIARELVAEGLLPLARREWIPGTPVGSLGASRVARIGAALELGRRIAAQSATSSEPIREPAEVAQRLIARYAHHVQETLGAIYLDSRNRILREREIFVGTLNAPMDTYAKLFGSSRNSSNPAARPREPPCPSPNPRPRPALSLAS